MYRAPVGAHPKPGRLSRPGFIFFGRGALASPSVVSRPNCTRAAAVEMRAGGVEKRSVTPSASMQTREACRPRARGSARHANEGPDACAVRRCRLPLRATPSLGRQARGVDAAACMPGTRAGTPCPCPSVRPYACHAHSLSPGTWPGRVRDAMAEPRIAPTPHAGIRARQPDERRWPQAGRRLVAASRWVPGPTSGAACGPQCGLHTDSAQTRDGSPPPHHSAPTARDTFDRPRGRPRAPAQPRQVRAAAGSYLPTRWRQPAPGVDATQGGCAPANGGGVPG